MFFRSIIVFLFALFVSQIHAQIPGCTDPQANNYNAAATINNGSCTYNALSYNPPLRANLTTTLKEISGMIYFNGKLLALNDSGDGNKLYTLDTTTGAVLQTIEIEGATNVDWEDIAQDSTYIYVGDCGNNSSGNRKDLVIYRINRSAFLPTGNFTIPASAVQRINFSYPEQTDFTSTGNNYTRFDCEAITIRRGKLHLFTKNWLGNYSVHYSLPIEPGTYSATRLDSLYTEGVLITAADLGADDELLLTGYSTTTAACNFYLIYGFDASDYFFNTGNRRQIQLPSAITTGQLESVCFVNATHGFIANEYAVFGGVLTVSNRLRTFNSLSWILDYYKHNPVTTIDYPGMLRYNKTTNKYEVSTATGWQNLKGQ